MDYLFTLAVIPHRLNFGSFTVSLDIWQWKASSFVIFQEFLGNSWLFAFHINFRVRLSFTHTHTHLFKFLLWLHWDQFWGKLTQRLPIHGHGVINMKTLLYSIKNSVKGRFYEKWYVLTMIFLFCLIWVLSGKECFPKLNWSSERCAWKNINQGNSLKTGL